MNIQKKATDNKNFLLLVTGTTPIIIETGPFIKTAVATPELLADDVTATHYAVGKGDQTGKPIVLGEPMTYADWRNPDRAWNVYQWGLGDGTWRWLKVSAEPSEVAAITLASTLCNEPYPDGATLPTDRQIPTFPAT